MPHVEGPVGRGAPGGAPDRKPERDPLLGLWLDERFLIEERIATGGFGAVYRGRTKDGQPVALKVLHDWLTSDDRIVARFRREGATLTQLHHPHTVRTLAVGETAEGHRYIAMELLSGESLDERLRRARVLPWQEAVAIARAVCGALAEAHALGVIHRDLKPANIHLTGPISGPPAVKVLDFGIAKITRGSAFDDGRELTHAGHMIGTCDYMSPEQLTNNDCRPPSDIYALGLVLYEMLAGVRAFPQTTGPAAMLATLLTQTPAPPSIHAAIPPTLDRVVMRCIERDPDARYPEVGELIAALDAAVAAHRTRDEITVVTPVIAPETWIDSASPWPVEPDGEAGDRTIAAPPVDLLIEPVPEPVPEPAIDPAPDPVPDPAPKPAPPVDNAPSFTTLSGVAVAPKRIQRHAGQLAAQPSVAPTLPPDSHIIPPRRIADPDVGLEWVPPLPHAQAVSPPGAPMARGSSSDLHELALLARRRRWAMLGWLACLIVCIAAITYAALLHR